MNSVLSPLRRGIAHHLALVWLVGWLGIAAGLGYLATPKSDTPKRADSATTVVKPIQDIRKGDLVWAHDPDTGELVQRRVTDIHRHFTYFWIDIAYKGGTLTATRFHPIWIENLGAWIEAIDVEPGMTMRRKDGTLVEITDVDIRELDKPEATYNFEVAGVHNYFAGRDGLLVHNGPGEDYFNAKDFIVYKHKDGLYVGRTRISLKYRYGKEMAKNYDIIHENQTYDQVRGLEQSEYEKAKRQAEAAKKKMRNQRNPIDPKRTGKAKIRAKKYKDAAAEFLKTLGKTKGC